MADRTDSFIREVEEDLRREQFLRLWQRYGHDRIIRDDVELLDRIRYVVNNPVVGGLADSPFTYPFLGSHRWTASQLLEICGDKPNIGLLRLATELDR